MQLSGLNQAFQNLYLIVKSCCPSFTPSGLSHTPSHNIGENIKNIFRESFGQTKTENSRQQKENLVSDALNGLYCKLIYVKSPLCVNYKVIGET